MGLQIVVMKFDGEDAARGSRLLLGDVGAGVRSVLGPQKAEAGHNGHHPLLPAPNLNAASENDAQ